MNYFPTDLYTRSLQPRELKERGFTKATWQVMRPISFVSDKWKTIIVPELIFTDLASIPRAIWVYIAPDDPIIELPSVVHDCMYQLGGVMPDGRVFTRDQADLILRDGMKAQGASEAKRGLVYGAVRAFGGSHWKKAA